MQRKNLTIFTVRKIEEMPVFLYRSRFIIAITFAIVLLLSGCVKNVITTQTEDFAEQYFLQNILTKEFTVKYAFNGTDTVTNEYTGFSFILNKGAIDIYSGTLTGSKSGSLYTSGSWSLTENYGKLIINFDTPSPLPTELNFLNRSWKFTKKSLPVMELAPWGVSHSEVLWMERK